MIRARVQGDRWQFARSRELAGLPAMKQPLSVAVATVSFPWAAATIASVAYHAACERPIYGVAGAVSSLCYLCPWFPLLLKPAQSTSLPCASVCFAATLLAPISTQAHIGGLRYWDWDHSDRAAYNGVAGNDIVNYDILGMFALTAAVAGLSVSLHFPDHGTACCAGGALLAAASHALLLATGTEPPKHLDAWVYVAQSGMMVLVALSIAALCFRYDRHSSRVVALDLAVIVSACLASTLSYATADGFLVDAPRWAPGAYPDHDVAASTFHIYTGAAICALITVSTCDGDDAPRLLTRTHCVLYALLLALPCLQCAQGICGSPLGWAGELFGAAAQFAASCIACSEALAERRSNRNY